MSEPTSAVQDPFGTARQLLAQARDRIERLVGGTGKLHIVVVLAAVLGLDTADKATVSAVAGSLETAFNIGNTDIGLLVSAVSFVAALATLPIGILVDRVSRKRVLLFSIVLWSVATWVSGTANSFVYLLGARVCLGAVAATATPAVASLTGDFFPAQGRARVYSLILGGELVGTGIGFVLAGLVSSWINWRWAFYCLAMLGLLLVWVIWKYLPEPARGGQGWLQTDGEQAEASQIDSGEAAPEPAGQRRRGPLPARPRLRRTAVQPRRELVLKVDPTGKSLWWTLRYVMKIPTYVRLIIASALGYYFFSGIRAFVMIYLTQHYGLARSSVSALVVVIGVGALLGLLAGGWIAEALLRRRILTARVVVPGVAAFISVLFLAPGILSTNVAFAIVMFTFGSASLAAANPGFDAARLDIMHPRLWGRAESIRTAMRMLAEGAAPTLFGFVSSYVFGGGQQGLTWTFLTMLVSLVAASALAIPARHSYPRDVATAAASVQRPSER